MVVEGWLELNTIWKTYNGFIVFDGAKSPER